MNLANQAANPGPAPFFLAATASAFFLGLGYVLWFNPRGYGARLMRLWYSASPYQVPDGHALAWRTRFFAVVYFVGGTAVATAAVLGFLGKFPPS
ncbi:hypothetical protein ACFWOL_21470 [Streptomyces sp. NPDC058442]|uniref:hypothetical protein n=1 Tax=Streptomyces sp. NPDC058442 TaxID=3346503 RepID=UPI0036478F8C